MGTYRDISTGVFIPLSDLLAGVDPNCLPELAKVFKKFVEVPPADQLSVDTLHEWLAQMDWYDFGEIIKKQWNKRLRFRNPLPKLRDIHHYQPFGEEYELIEDEDPDMQDGELYAVFEVKDCFKLISTEKGRALARASRTHLKISGYYCQD